MKKLIMAVAVAAIAGIAQAATITWGSGALKTAASADGGWSGTGVNAANALVTMSVYFIDADTLTSLAGKSQKDLFDAYNGQVASLTGQNKNASTGALIGAVTIRDTNAAEAAQPAVVIVTYTDPTYNKEFFMATTTTSSFSAGTHSGAASNLIASVANWQAIPEPTSGLLMLLGMAGLALRRRRT